MINHWQEITDFWYKMGGRPSAGVPLHLRLDQATDMANALFMEVAELQESWTWKKWRQKDGVEVDKANVAREIVDCLFFLHHIADTFGLDDQDLEGTFNEVLLNNRKRYHDGDFSDEEEEKSQAIHERLDKIDELLSKVIKGDINDY